MTPLVVGDLTIDTDTCKFFYKGVHVLPCGELRPETATSVEDLVARLLGRLEIRSAGDPDWIAEAVEAIKVCAPYTHDGFSRRDTVASLLGLEGQAISRWMRDYAPLPFLKVGDFPARSRDIETIRKMTLPGAAVRPTGTMSAFRLVPFVLAIVWFRRHQQTLTRENRNNSKYTRISLVS